MDWSNEPFRKLYTRDTTTWSMLPWEARALLCFLLRKIPSNGRLPLGGYEPSEAIAALVGMPVEAVQRGLEALLRGKNPTAVLEDDTLALPNFSIAQESRVSERVRKAQQRERERAENRSDVPPAPKVQAREDSRGISVTGCDSLSHYVTPCHNESHGATESHEDFLPPSLNSLLQEVVTAVFPGELISIQDKLPMSARPHLGLVTPPDSHVLSDGVTMVPTESQIVTKRIEENRRDKNYLTPLNPPKGGAEGAPANDYGSGAEVELLGEKLNPEAPLAQTGRKSKRPKRGEPEETPDDILAVLTAMRDAVRELDSTRDGPRDSPQNRELIRRPMRECKASVADWVYVIRVQLEDVRKQPQNWGYLTLPTLSVPRNFQRALDKVSPAARKAAEASRSFGLSDWSNPTEPTDEENQP